MGWTSSVGQIGGAPPWGFEVKASRLGAVEQVSWTSWTQLMIRMEAPPYLKCAIRLMHSPRPRDRRSAVAATEGLTPPLYRGG